MDQPDSQMDLQVLLDEMEATAPDSSAVPGTKVTYRTLGDSDIVEDSLESEELLENAPSHSQDSNEAEAPDAFQYLQEQDVPIAAVDCGIARLGETESGLIIALRASIIIDDGPNSRVQLYRTGPLYLHNLYKPQIMFAMGKHLGQSDFFVNVDDSDSANPKLVDVKHGIADDSHRFGDRFRNWLERLVQRVAVTSVSNGVILFDGALTLRTADTPQAYMRRLGDLARAHGNAVIAISKQSSLQLRGRPIRFWLNDVPQQVCYRPLATLLSQEDRDRIMGNAYAARFSVLGPTFRMDVLAASGQTDHEAIGRMYSSILMRGGYPDILVRAHTHSYFTSPDVLQLQALANAKFGLVAEPEVELSGIFAPFGGRFK